MRAARDWPGLPLLFGGALATYAAGLPFGLERTVAGASVAAGGQLNGGVPLASLLMRAIGYLPVGDLATRANLASAIAGAAAVALLGRLACELLRLLPAPEPSRQPSDDVEPIAAVGAAGVGALVLGSFRAATGAGAAAVTVALAAAAWVYLLRLLRTPDDARTGTRLALLAGLCAGVEPAAAPLVWIPAALLWFRALRRGARWPLVAPLLFVAGLSVVLFAVAASDAPSSVGELVRRLWPAAAPSAARVAPTLELGEELGVLGLLLAVVGALVLFGRAPLACALVLWWVGGGLWLSGGVRLAAAATVAPLAVGIAHLAAKLGRARLAAATAIAVMALVSPALDGGAWRWRRDVRLPARLLTRALDAVPLRAAVDPGTPEMAGLFHYAAALGLRPDLTVERR
jgi:hypothetical protein